MVQPHDVGTFPVLWDASAPEPWTPSAATSVVWTRAPVALSSAGERNDLLDHVVTTEVSASYQFADLLQAGVSVPSHVAVVWEGELLEPRLGDMAVWVRAPFEPQVGLPMRAAIFFQMDLALGDPAHYLGDPGGGITGGLALETGLRAWTLAGNLALRIQESTPLPGLTWGERLQVGVGARRLLVGPLDGAVELFGSGPVRVMDPDQAKLQAVPIEVVASSGVAVRPWGAGPWRVAVRAGVGRGLTLGLGSPRWRALMTLEVRQDPSFDSDGDGIPDHRDRCITAPEDRDFFQDRDGCPDPDNDQDGLLDGVDECPNQPETWNGHADQDGCPDVVTLLRLQITSTDPDRLEAADVLLGDGPPRTLLAEEVVELAVPPGELPVRVTAPGHRTHESTLTVPPGEPLELRIVLDEIRVGQLELRLTDPAGAPLSGRVRLGSGPLRAVPPEGRAWELPAGDLVVRAVAPGSRVRDVWIEVPPDGHVALVLALNPAIAQLDGDALSLGDEVAFTPDSAELDDGDRDVLDRLAALLLAHPELELVRVEGHADETGDSAYNYALSVRRAQAVVAWLVAAGVDAERLQALGTGEARSAADTDPGDRRVSFLVLVWAPSGPPPSLGGI